MAVAVLGAVVATMLSASSVGAAVPTPAVPDASTPPSTAVPAPAAPEPVVPTVDAPLPAPAEAVGGPDTVAASDARVAEDMIRAPVAALAVGPPSVNVSPTSGLNPAGGSTLSVTGSGFDPDANTKFGIYVVFGPVDPATYFSDANRFLAAMWLHPGGAASGSAGQGDLRPDGTFATTLPAAGGAPLTAQYTDGNGAPVNCLITQCYVVTMAAHGVKDRSQDTCTPVSFAGGTATPNVDRSCRPVTNPAGQPTASGTGGGATNGGSGTTGGSSTMGTTGSGSSGASSALPKTGSTTPPLAATGLVLVLSGLLIGHRTRRDPAKSRPASEAVRLDRHG